MMITMRTPTNDTGHSISISLFVLVGLILILGIALSTQDAKVTHAQSFHDPEASLDSDVDGLPDQVEALLGTNPFEADTDLDGKSDGQEVALQTSPLIHDETHGSQAAGVSVEVFPNPAERKMGLFIVATSDEGFQDIRGASIGLVGSGRYGRIDGVPEGDIDDEALLAHFIHKRTGLFLRHGKLKRSADGTVVSLYVPEIPYRAIPHRIGVLARFRTRTGEVSSAIEYFGNRSGFYRLAFSPGADGVLQATHIYHLSQGLIEDTTNLDEHEDCRQYVSPIVTNPEIPPTVFMVMREQCESRDGYYCPPNCGSDVGQIIVKM